MRSGNLLSGIKSTGLLLAMSVLLLASPVAATTITFDPVFPSIPADVTVQYFDDSPGGAQLTLPVSNGVALDAESSAIPGGGNALGLRGGHLPSTAYYGALLTFTNLESFVSAVGNDFGGDPVADNERVFLSIFDSGGLLIGSTTAQGPYATPNLQPISISSGLANIRYATFTFNNDLGYYAVDNFEYRGGAAASVPEPASLLLVGTGVVSLLRRRSRKHQGN